MKYTKQEIKLIHTIKLHLEEGNHQSVKNLCSAFIRSAPNDKSLERRQYATLEILNSLAEV